MRKLFSILFIAGLLAGLVGFAPLPAAAQAPEVTLDQLDALFGADNYLCYPDTASGSHIKVPSWPRGLKVQTPLLRVEQPYSTFEVGTQPQSGVVSDAWLDAELSVDARANCPSIPSDGEGDVRDLAITLAEVQEALGGPDAEFSCFWDRRDGVRAVLVPEGSIIDPPITHLDTNNGVVVRGSEVSADLEGTAWLQGKLAREEWQSCPKWGVEEPENRILETPRGSAAVLQALLKALGVDVTGIAPAATPVAAALPAASPTATVAAQLDSLVGTGNWACFPDRLDAVEVPSWPDGIVIGTPAGAANTPSGNLEVGQTPTTGERVTIWLESGLEVDRAECP